MSYKKEWTARSGAQLRYRKPSCQQRITSGHYCLSYTRKPMLGPSSQGHVRKSLP
ncbi:hypothetical protein CERZMDRAFT_108520 [Cercospora zeae-maydis SCOH1-5]|uniref:Uncharacterized protein n=1 Tax=Cercospora zeae-maydis SCOH1-5 TaxID=717836 RepID=A0A6A6FX09_9PEZI|nr:hypothetical protein CERZMDRAFT_108520 [Cercospora zeae-maydis SCOH1-5]